MDGIAVRETAAEPLSGGPEESPNSAGQCAG